jgi:hypothetical protein
MSDGYSAIRNGLRDATAIPGLQRYSNTRIAGFPQLKL